MAVKAELIQHQALIHLDLYPGERRFRTTDDPCIPGYALNGNVWFYWDDEKLERGEREFLGVEVDDIERLTDDDLRALDHISPRIDILELHLYDLAMSDVLRQVRNAYRRQQAGVFG